jgi:DNA polymerase III delta prime subunit
MPGAADIIGNRAVMESLARVAKAPGLGHAYLFHGPEGVGKRMAAMALARAVNCECEGGEDACASCKSLDELNHPEVLVLQDANKPVWLSRRDLIGRLGLAGEEDPAGALGRVVASLADRGYLDDPVPRIDLDLKIDGYTIAADLVFGKGSVPSRECFTPGPAVERIRKQYDGGDLSESEFRLLKLLYENPLSVMPYRGSIPIAYIAQRRGWKSVRPIQSVLSMRMMFEGRKVVVIDDAHKMTAEAQNCLLKTLEEPPPDSLLILVTSDRHALFRTIVSRCQSVAFGRLGAAEMREAEERLAGGGERFRLAASLAEGCPGGLLSLGMTDIDRRLDETCRLFGDIAEGRLEAVFAFSRGILEEGGSHRRKVQDTVRRAFELMVFWIGQIRRCKRGLPTAPGSEPHDGELKAQASLFTDSDLLAASARIEKAFGLLRWNVDLTLLLHTTLLQLR